MTSGPVVVTSGLSQNSIILLTVKLPYALYKFLFEVAEGTLYPPVSASLELNYLQACATTPS